MKNRKASRWIAWTSALSLCTLASMASAHDHRGDDFGQLNLSDAQRASVQQIETANSAQTAGLRQAVEKQRAAFDAMTPNQAGYQAAAAELAQAEAQETQTRIIQHARMNAQIYAMLTASQQAELAQLKAARVAREAQWQQFQAQHPLPTTTITGR